MKVLVYPHTMEIGGSQLNAIEIAAAVRDRGHDVTTMTEGEDREFVIRDCSISTGYIKSRK